MAVTSYAGWVADGKPAYEAQPILDMVAMFQSHGYTVYWYPDQRHLTAAVPEDHTPYSHTPWPGAQPYPLCLALDLMPKSGDARELTPIARQIIADKDSGRAPWVKYLNWTDEKGAVWHTKWQPDKVTTSSTDSGHIHISVRTDYADPKQAQAAGVSIYAAQGWDPISGSGGVTMFLAITNNNVNDPATQWFICDGMTSVPITKDQAATKVYLATENSGPAFQLVRGSAANEWGDFSGQKFIVRYGWTPAFGAIQQAATLTDAQVKQIADQVAASIEPGASKADVQAVVSAALNATKLVSS